MNATNIYNGNITNLNLTEYSIITNDYHQSIEYVPPHKSYFMDSPSRLEFLAVVLFAVILSNVFRKRT